jgi:hypothetical protein
MIEQYLPNNNETATVAFRQKFCQLNSPLVHSKMQKVFKILRHIAYAGTCMEH